MGKFVLNITPWTLLHSGWLGDCLESFEKNSVNQNCLIRLSCSLAGGDTRKLGLSSGAPVQLGSNIITNWINDKYITRTEPWTLFYCFTFTILLDYFFCLLLVVLWSCTQVFSFVVCCCCVAWPTVMPPIPRQFNQWPSVFIVNNKRKPLCMVNSNIDESKKDSDLFNPMQRYLFIALVWVREFWLRWFGRG